MRTRRCFIALDVSEPVVEAVTELLSAFRRSGTAVRWVSPRNLHLTLRFLGQLDPERVSAARQALREAVPGLPGFSFKVAGIGGFPSLERPKVIWAGIEAPRELDELWTALDEALVRRGFGAAERPFRAHLTLGRIRTRAAAEEGLRVLEEMSGRSFGRVDVSEVALKESVLTAGAPPRYSDLFRVALEPVS